MRPIPGGSSESERNGEEITLSIGIHAGGNKIQCSLFLFFGCIESSVNDAYLVTNIPKNRWD